MKQKDYRKSFIRQHDQTDCGVACLASVVKYYGSDTTLEQLRAISGTSSQGTTLLGLCQAAKRLHFEADGFEITDLTELSKVTKPYIAHWRLDDKMEHYVVVYEHKNNGNILIGDPAKGIIEIPEVEFYNSWSSMILLQVTPNKEFKKIEHTKKQKLRWFVELIRPEWPILAITALLGVIITLLGFSMALFSQKLIDEILPKHQTKNLILGLVLLVLLLFIKAGISYFRTVLLLQQSQSFNNRLSNSFYEKLLRLSKIFFDTRKTGDLIARMHDTRRIQSVISSSVGSILIDIIIMITSIAFIFSYSAFIGSFLLLCIPFFGTLAWYFHNPIVKGQKNIMTGYAQVESQYIDSITGILAIKATNTEHYFTKISENIYHRFQQKIFDLGIIGGRYGLWGDGMGIFLALGVLGASSWLVLEQQLRIGQMMALLGISSGMIGAVARLTTLNIQFQEARIAFDRMYEFANSPSESMSNDNITVLTFSKLVISNISFRFIGRTAFLKDISLEVHKGEMVALLSESGCGKSTLLQILEKFYDWETGDIMVNDTCLRKIKTTSWRNIIGVVPQEIKIFSGTIIENIIMGRTTSSDNKVVDFCEKYGFDRFIQKLPQDYSTIVGEHGVQLSGGQKQIVGLARALYSNPHLLLLDEATAAMDRNTEKFVMNLLKDLKNEIAILLITHKVQTAQEADRIYIIENGCISHTDTPYALLRTSNLYSDSWKELENYTISA